MKLPWTPSLARLPALLASTARSFWRERTWRMAAGVAFYTLFAAGPLLVLLLELSGLLVGEDEMRDRILELMGSLTGEEGAEAVEGLLDNFSLPEGGWVGRVLGLWMLFFGGTNAVGQLRQAIRSIWGLDEDDEARAAEEARDRERSGWLDKLVEAAFVAGLGLLVMTSVLLGSLLLYARAQLDDGGLLAAALFRTAESGLVIVVLGAAFAVTFRHLPARKLPWSSIVWGALLSAVLFAVGRFLMILWLATTDPGSVYGSMSFLMVFLAWVYVSAQVTLFGAAFTAAVEREREADA